MAFAASLRWDCYFPHMAARFVKKVHRQQKRTYNNY